MKAPITLLRRLCLSVLLAAFSYTALASSGHHFVTAHRGGHIDNLIPENSIAGVASAKAFGFKAIECDPKVTSDGVVVLMHDNTINRTMRMKEGYKKIKKKIKVSDLTFEELRTKYVLASEDEAQRVPAPTLEELCMECTNQGIKMMLHTGIKQAVSIAKSIMGEDWICFSSSKEVIRYARNEGFKGLCLYSTEERNANEIIEFLESIGKPCGISSMDKQKASNPDDRQYKPEFIDALKSKGFEVQASIFAPQWEQRAVREGVTMVLSDNCWYQDIGRSADEAWRIPGKRYCAGTVLEHDFGKIEGHGAITASIKFKGELTVCIDKEEFKFKHEKLSSETISLRAYGSAPHVRIEIVGKTKFKPSKVEVFHLAQ